MCVWEAVSVDPLDSALLVYRAENRGEVFASLAQDPYAKNGIWAAITVREWSVAIE